MHLIRPPRLNPGDVVGVISPSFGALGQFSHRTQQAVNNLYETWGFRVRFAAHALDSAGWVSSSPKDRAADLHELVADPDVKAIVTGIGGDHSNQMLPYLDWDLIGTHPKIFMGYSDGTVLALAIYRQTGLVTFYGPALATNFAEYPAIHPYTAEGFTRALMESQPMGPIVPSPNWTDEFLDWATRADQTRARIMKPNPGPFWIRPGEAEGPMVGGCLESLEHLRGTRYWPDWQDALLFVELSEEIPSPSRIDAMLQDYENMGVFDQIRGILLGRLYRYPKEDVDPLYAVFRQRTAKWRLPILAGLDFGHTEPNLTIPIGVRGRMDLATGWSILESAVYSD